jgi:hypothetical protein
MKQKQKLFEVNPQGEKVWEINPSDSPETGNTQHSVEEYSG